MKIICSVLGAQTHLSTPYEAKRARGSSAQDRSHGVCVAQTNQGPEKNDVPFPCHILSSLSAMHCTGASAPQPAQAVRVEDCPGARD